MWGFFGRAHDVEGVRALLQEGRSRMQGDLWKLSAETARRAAAVFNEAYPVGTPVRYWPGAERSGPGTLSKTTGEATAVEAGGRTVPAVRVEGCDDFVVLTNVEPVDEAEGTTP